MHIYYNATLSKTVTISTVSIIECIINTVLYISKLFWVIPREKTGLQWTIFVTSFSRKYYIKLLAIPEPLPPPVEKNIIIPYKLSIYSKYLFNICLH